MSNMRHMELAELTSFFERIQQDFAQGEYAPYAVMYQQIKDTRQKGIVFCEEEQDLAYAVCTDNHNNGYVLISLLAVFHDFRGRGIGSDFMKALSERYRHKQAILVEVERPDQAQTPEERDSRRQRIQFYAKSGFYLIEGIDYSIWDIPMHLMELPLLANKNVIDQEVKKTMYEIYLSLLGKKFIHKMQFQVKSKNQRPRDAP